VRQEPREGALLDEVGDPLDPLDDAPAGVERDEGRDDADLVAPLGPRAGVVVDVDSHELDAGQGALHVRLRQDAALEDDAGTAPVGAELEHHWLAAPARPRQRVGDLVGARRRRQRHQRQQRHQRLPPQGSLPWIRTARVRK
jgi:hypothetical protein